MKSKLLFIPVLCVAMLGCKDEPVEPGDPQITMSASSQTLVEGGEAIDLIIELDRDIAKPYNFYLDYGASYGENTVFFDPKANLQSLNVNLKDKAFRVLAIPFLAGERKKVIRLKAEDNHWYRGDRPIEFKVLSLADYVDKKPIYHASLDIGYQENEPRPVFGIQRNWPQDTERSLKAHTGEFKLTLIANIPFQFPQKIYLNYSGTADAGVHYEQIEYIVFEGRLSSTNLPYSHPTVLKVKGDGNFEPEKNVRIELASAEDGEIAKDDVAYPDNNGEPLQMGDYFNLILRAN